LDAVPLAWGGQSKLVSTFQIRAWLSFHAHFTPSFISEGIPKKVLMASLWGVHAGRWAHMFQVMFNFNEVLRTFTSPPPAPR